MIEKITNQNQIARHKLAEKINELIDAVNILQAQVAILEEHAHPTAKIPEDKGYIKLETPEDKGYIKLDNDSLQKFLKAHPEYNNNGVIEIPKKEPADPYAEQRKYLCKLCWFWNENYEDGVIGVLTGVFDNADRPFERNIDQTLYKHCEPVKPDDDIIYKGEQQ